MTWKMNWRELVSEICHVYLQSLRLPPRASLPGMQPIESLRTPSWEEPHVCFNTLCSQCLVILNNFIFELKLCQQCWNGGACTQAEVVQAGSTSELQWSVQQSGVCKLRRQALQTASTEQAVLGAHQGLGWSRNAECKDEEPGRDLGTGCQ